MTADELRAAEAGVRRDLTVTRAWSQGARAQLVACVAHRRWWLAQWPDGAVLVPGLLAQDMQEWMHEHADRQWPLCPEHGDHPLYVEPDLGPDAFWVCHRSGLPIAAVGNLPVT